MKHNILSIINVYPLTKHFASNIGKSNSLNMSTQQKTLQVNEAIKRQLEMINFVSVRTLQIPISFILDNERPNGAFNVISVDSTEQAEEISMNICSNKNIINNVKDYSKPLYLTVLISLPRQL